MSLLFRLFMAVVACPTLQEDLFLDQAGINQQVRLDVVVEVGRSWPSSMTTGDHRSARPGRCDVPADPSRHRMSTEVLDQN